MQRTDLARSDNSDAQGLVGAHAGSLRATMVSFSRSAPSRNSFLSKSRVLSASIDKAVTLKRSKVLFRLGDLYDNEGRGFAVHRGQGGGAFDRRVSPFHGLDGDHRALADDD